MKCGKMAAAMVTSAAAQTSLMWTGRSVKSFGIVTITKENTFAHPQFCGYTL